MVLWRDYLIWLYFGATSGLFLWNMTENPIFYFEVCHSFFSSPGALKPNSRQMGFVPRCTKVVDDVLFITLVISDGNELSATYRCIHIPSLVISTQLPGGSVSLTENAFAVHLPKCIMEPHATGSLFPFQTQVYSIPACSPTHPRYCFIRRIVGQSRGVEWEVLEVEIDLTIPGPIKIFSRVSQQYTVQRPTSLIHDIDDDLLLYFALGRGVQPRASPSVRFLRVGKPGKWRVARLGGVDKMRLSGLNIDRDTGYVIIWTSEGWPRSTRECGYICWLDERKSGDMVYSRTKELISSWSRELLRRF